MELKIEGLSKSYKGKLVVDDFSFSIQEGIYGLLGANGAGKTTLMRMMCDLLEPTTGAVMLNGQNIKKLGESYRDQLGYLPQNFGYYPNFTAWNFMMYLASLKGLPKGKAKNRCKELLEMVGLYEDRKKKLKTYSGGMKQRIGIAQALINDPKILILDEPTVGLDPGERSKFRNIISDYATHRIVILSTHIVSDVEYIADHIMIMKDGKLSQEAKANEICQSISDYVWQCKVSHQEVEDYKSKFIVSNLKNYEDAAELRIVSEMSPCQGAINISPNLEDLYLYHFRRL
ncbi:ABC-2 type transport system ATP-binding protein [Natranaerovirga hydrolytica]|uniref:ABC-2 type transport system ATP-binding protein n=1 Tax=Natranaerovirga hydrolytica TaxID=680378 RepID=A0A4R1MMR0_9FIRM|nr:ABC transporter ATP-binding protein [Natranaerovirga hydrolytica]TCK93182.1 ABC-2 type transport system ATP-binding protein [Natranaerovirga hydrolytica]